jgi:hypothetical protein
LIAAGSASAARGRPVIAKNHPMYPISLSGAVGITETTTSLRDQKTLSGVLYSTGTSGLEALLAGLPTYRLMLDDRIAIDILPRGMTAVPVTLATAADIVSCAATPKMRVDRSAVLSPPDMDLWSRLLLEMPGERAAHGKTFNTPQA